MAWAAALVKQSPEGVSKSRGPAIAHDQTATQHHSPRGVEEERVRQDTKVLPGSLDKHRLLVTKTRKRALAMVGTHATVAHAAKWQLTMTHMHECGVDGHAASTRVGQHLLLKRFAFAEDIPKKGCEERRR